MPRTTPPMAAICKDTRTPETMAVVMAKVLPVRMARRFTLLPPQVSAPCRPRALHARRPHLAVEVQPPGLDVGQPAAVLVLGVLEGTDGSASSAARRASRRGYRRTAGPLVRQAQRRLARQQGHQEGHAEPTGRAVDKPFRCHEERVAHRRPPSVVPGCGPPTRSG